jgi:DNA repair protein RadC
MKINSESSPEYVTNHTLNHALIEEARDHLLAHLRGRRLMEEDRLTSPKQVADYLQLYFADREYEVFTVLFLDTQHRLLAVEDMFRGTLDAASVYPREILKAALACNAGALILAHNHPSGDPSPSEADKRITHHIKDVVGLVAIRTLDHVVVGEGTYSFAENGLI